MIIAFIVIGNAMAENIALFQTATMEPGPGWGHVAHHAIDGDFETLAQSATPVWDLKVDLGEEYPIGSVRIHPSEGGWADEYSIKVSTDNKTWTTVDTVARATDQVRTIDFDEIDARYVWMDVTGVAHDDDYGHAVYEFEVFAAATYKPISFEKQGLKMELSPSGRISSLTLPSKDKDEIQFRTGGYHAGPSWIIDGQKVRLSQKNSDELLFSGKQGDVAYSIEYKKDGEKLAIVASLKNEGQKTFKPDAARLMLGVNAEMIKYPDWNDKFFPTLIRGEKTHLWGYFMSPKGRVLTISSPDPIASWNYEYQPQRHRIYTVSLDMLHKLPLPERHPQDLTELQPGEEKTWTIFLQEVDSLADVKPVVSSNVNAPMIDIDRYTIADGEQSVVSVISGETVRLTVTDPEGNTSTVKPRKDRSAELYHYSLKPKSGIGQYTLRAKNKSGKITEASVYVRHPWSWYIKQARKEAIRIPQKASTHTESWLGHYATMAARRYFPDEKMDTLAEENFRTILPLMYDVKTGRARPGTGFQDR
jgi:hypothetical protein